VPIHLQNACVDLGYEKGDFPVSERLAEEVLSLPMYPELTFDQQREIVERIQQFFSEESRFVSGKSPLRPVSVNRPAVLRARGCALSPAVTDKV